MNSTYHIPSHTMASWQKVIDLMAKTTNTPAGLIMRLEPTKAMSVFVSSTSEGNAWKPGDQCSESGLYCETVIRTGDALLVPDALKDPVWDHNPDLKQGMSFYLGYPLLWPNGEPFGTICVLDTSTQNHAIECRELIVQFKNIIESDLKLIVEIEERKTIESQLIAIKLDLEDIVEQRTQHLQETNTALKVLLNEHEATKKTLESSMLANINELIIPNLHKAKKSIKNVKTTYYLDLVESSLNNITSKFSSELVQNFSDLTRAEIQVANLIRQGKKTKEIADSLNIATSTVDYHRANIRKKMGLQNQSTSLNTHLASFFD